MYIARIASSGRDRKIRVIDQRSRPADRLTARRGGPLVGRFAVPGDKSISHRALILAALAEGSSRLVKLNDGADVAATVAALRAFGAIVERIGTDEWRVTGGQWSSPDRPIDCGNSGTSARLLLGAAAGQGIAAMFDGDSSLRRRPMARLIAPICAMGATVGGGPTLPLALAAGSIGGIDWRSEVASAQVKTAILLAGLGTDSPVMVTEPSPSRDHDQRMFPLFGVEVDGHEDGNGWTVSLGRRRTVSPADLTIPGDPSAAAFGLVATALVPGSAVSVENMSLNPRRIAFLEALRAMGAEVSWTVEGMASGDPLGTTTARFGRLRGIDVAAGRIPALIDELPLLAVAAAFARGESRFEGVSELRHKESDRLAAVVDGLRRCGAEAEAIGDRLRILGVGGPIPGGAEVSALGDHRIAMAFLVAGLASERPITVDGTTMISTSFPGFVAAMRSIGAAIEEGT